MKAIRVHAIGGPEVLVYEDVPAPQPGAGQALVRVEACGVNFIDIYHRTGFYPLPLPFTPGQEGAGVVERVGAGVTHLKQGDRVAWASILGAYAERCVLPADRLVTIPEGVTARQAAAVILQGMTAHYLATSTHPLKSGEVCLVHAAAGGVGCLLVQIAKLHGAHVIATVGSEAKAAIARELGADEVILYRSQDVVAEVKRITHGAMCRVVYDSVGKDTVAASIACTAPRGLLALYGQSSGAIGPLDPLPTLAGSKFMTRATLKDYIVTREDLVRRAGDVFVWMQEGRLKVRVHKEYPLKDVATAHRDLEGRGTTGKLLLVV